MKENKDPANEAPCPGFQIGPNAWLHFRRDRYPSPEAIAEWNRYIEKLKAEGVSLFQDADRRAVQLYPQRPTFMQRIKALLWWSWR